MELSVISSLVLPLLGPRLQHFLSAAGMPGLLIEGCNTCFLGLLWGPRGFFPQLLPQSSGLLITEARSAWEGSRLSCSFLPGPCLAPPFVSFILGFGHAIIITCKGG